jgi:predicted ATPase
MIVSPFSGNSFTHLVGNNPLQPEQRQQCEELLSRIRLFRFDPIQLATAVQLVPNFELDVNGLGLPGVLDRLRDEAPERFDSLNTELGEWFPEYDRILFDTPGPGNRHFLVRTRASSRPIPASELSEGTLLGVALLTLAHLANPPSLVLIEEPDRGIHPRLLRRVQDALYRLAYPQSAGEKRPAVQVVATTHSPYFLDLFRDHPEEVVIAERRGAEAQFQRLVDRPDFEQILEGAPLGEVWYSGVLGGVPVGS